MRLLVDTKVFLWTAFEPARLTILAREAIEDLENELLVSAIVPLELGMAVHKGRIALGEPINAFYRRRLRALGRAWELPFSVEHALKTAALPYTHRDPMDRMLAAQAVVERVPLVTSDREIASLGCEIIW